MSCSLTRSHFLSRFVPLIQETVGLSREAADNLLLGQILFKSWHCVLVLVTVLSSNTRIFDFSLYNFVTRRTFREQFSKLNS